MENRRMIPPDFQSWRCCHHDDRFCPPEGCAKSYGCAIDQGWSQGQPTPPGCDGIHRTPIAADVSTLPRWIERLAVFLVNGATRFFGVLTEIVRAVAEISPVAWFIIIAVITFTVVVLI
jgi:hypothetical protein